MSSLEPIHLLPQSEAHHVCPSKRSLLLPLLAEISFPPKCQVRPCHSSAQNPGMVPCPIRVKAKT